MIPGNFCISDKILIIPDKNGFKVIPVEEIILFERCPSGTTVTCISEDHTTAFKVPLSALETVFGPKGFYRIHKSYLINTVYLIKFDHTEGALVTMCNRKQYPVARAKCRDFLLAMLKPFRDLIPNTTGRSPENTGDAKKFTVCGFLSDQLLIALYIWQVISDTAPIETFLS